MAKGIKRAGIVVFALVISFLLVMSCLFSNNFIIENQNFDLEKDNSNEIATIVAPPQVDASHTINLTGTDSEMHTQFNDAKKLSKEKSTTYKIVLQKDWNLSASLYIYEGENIMVDLNGFTINRGQTQAVGFASCFYVYEKLYLTDSKFVANSDNIKAQVKKIYENKGNKTNAQIIAELSAIDCGKITGGMTTGHGGAINIKGTNDSSSGIVYVYGGLMYNNNSISDVGGGAIYGYDDSNLYFYDGIVAANTGTIGGGISISGQCNITNGLIIGNTSTSPGYGGGGIFVQNNYNVISNVDILYNSANNHSGGGIFLKSGKYDISNVNVSYNTARYATGIYACQDAILNIDNTVIDNNVSQTFGGGLYVTDNSITKLSNCIVENNQSLASTSECGAGGIQVNYKATLYASNIKVRNNYANTDGGGISISRDGRMFLSGSNDIVDNRTDDGKSDLFLENSRKLDINGILSLGESGKGMYVNLAGGYDKFTTFTLGYERFGNSNVDPSTLFYLDNSNVKAKVKNGEVIFDYSADSNYDFIYLDNGYRKSYKENDKLHKYNDSNLNLVDGNAVYILGGISLNTSVNEFIANLAVFGINNHNMELYDSQGNPVYVNGVANSNISSDIMSNGNELAVGTGWYVVANGETIYLSILGDINGDGRISASDVTILRQLASDKEEYNNLSIEKKLACMVINKGNVTTADAEILRNVIDKKIEIELFY